MISSFLTKKVGNASPTAPTLLNVPHGILQPPNRNNDKSVSRGENVPQNVTAAIDEETQRASSGHTSQLHHDNVSRQGTQFNHQHNHPRWHHQSQTASFSSLSSSPNKIPNQSRGVNASNSTQTAQVICIQL